MPTLWMGRWCFNLTSDLQTAAYCALNLSEANTFTRSASTQEAASTCALLMLVKWATRFVQRTAGPSLRSSKDTNLKNWSGACPSCVVREWK